MNKTFKILLLLFCTISFRNGNAQILSQPDGILLQMVARDASGNAASVRNVYAKISIIKTSATGPAVYVETHQTVTMTDGIFTVIIGKGSRIAGVPNITSIDWRGDLYFLNLKVAVEPSIPGPGWDPNNEYVDMGTSQMWTVPYAFFANRANISDSAVTISSLLPGSKGGTGVVNDGKTITLDKNFALRGLGNLTFNTSGPTILNLPTSGNLTSTYSADSLFNKSIFSPRLLGEPKSVTPDITSNDSSVATTKFVNSILEINKNILTSKIDLVASNASSVSNDKLNISDTASMLNKYRLSMIDKDAYKVSNNAVVAALVADTSTLITRLGYKVNFADTAAMLNAYRLSMIDKDAYKVSNDAVVAALVADTATLITRLGYKVNYTDTAAMLNVYRLSMIDKDAYKVSNNAVVAALVADSSTLITRLGYKVNFADTAAMLNAYRLSMIDKDAYKVSNDAVVAALVADTATLITRLGYKVNAADTAAMLNSRFARDTVSLSNRINDLSAIAGGNLDAEILRATTAENLKVNFTDTAAMLNTYRLSMIDKDAYKLSNDGVVASLVADTATLITRLGYKVNLADTAAMLNVYRLSMIDKDAYKVSNDAVVAALVTDTATLITRLGYKVNAADTAAMLNLYRLSMIDKDAYKVSNDAVVAALVSDTATLITRLGYKVNAADTAAMLDSRFTRDTASLSNRIDVLSASAGGSLAAEILRATTAENLKVNFTDTAAMLNTYRLSMIDKDAYKVSNDAVVAALVTDTATLITRLGYKVNAADTVAMLSPYARKFTKDFNVKISTGKFFGKYKNDDVIPAIGKTLDDFMTDVLTETIHPTYVIPTTSITAAPSNGDYEIGTPLSSINFSSTYNQNDGGAIVSTTYKKSTNGGTTYSNLVGTTDNIPSLVSSVYYQVNISYGNGAVKNNNLGVSDNVGIITAGNVTSGTIVFTPRSKKYWGTSDNTSITDAVILANSSEFGSAKAKSAFNVSVASGTKYIYYAYPASYGTLSSITVGGFESYSAFTLITTNVVNAQGYSQAYNIYVSVNNFTETVSNVICN